MLIQGILLTFVEISPNNMKTPGKVLFSGLIIVLAALTSAFISSPGRSARSSPQYDGYISAKERLWQMDRMSGLFYKDLFSENAVKTSAKYVLVLKPEE